MGVVAILEVQLPEARCKRRSKLRYRRSACSQACILPGYDSLPKKVYSQAGGETPNSVTPFALGERLDPSTKLVTSLRTKY